MSEAQSSAPYGTYAPGALRAALRSVASHLPPSGLGRRLASLARRMAGANAERPFDVEIFDGQRVRLYPSDNLCEKRVYATPQLWDVAERGALAAAIADSSGSFHFADVGANVGLYTLYACGIGARLGKTVRVVAVEPEPTLRARCEFNLSANALGHVTLLPCAVSDAPCELALPVNPVNRGQSGAGPAAEILRVSARPLLDILRAARFERLDALKIDIEGAESPVLRSFFANAPRSLWPALIIVETLGQRGAGSAFAACVEHGYQPLVETKMNAVLTLQTTRP
jgi:FkbM family methyltransferase